MDTDTTKVAFSSTAIAVAKREMIAHSIFKIKDLGSSDNLNIIDIADFDIEDILQAAITEQNRGDSVTGDLRQQQESLRAQIHKQQDEIKRLDKEIKSQRAELWDYQKEDRIIRCIRDLLREVTDMVSEKRISVEAYDYLHKIAYEKL